MLYTAGVSKLIPKDKKVTMNFSEPFLEELRKYAEANDMKLNAVVVRAFHKLLEAQNDDY